MFLKITITKPINHVLYNISGIERSRRSSAQTMTCIIYTYEYLLVRSGVAAPHISYFKFREKARARFALNWFAIILLAVPTSTSPTTSYVVRARYAHLVTYLYGLRLYVPWLRGSDCSAVVMFARSFLYGSTNIYLGSAGSASNTITKTKVNKKKTSNSHIH